MFYIYTNNIFHIILCIKNINPTFDNLLISLQTLNYSNYLKEWALTLRHAQVLFITIQINYKRTFTNLSR